MYYTRCQFTFFHLSNTVNTRKKQKLKQNTNKIKILSKNRKYIRESCGKEIKRLNVYFEKKNNH